MNRRTDNAPAFSRLACSLLASVLASVSALTAQPCAAATEPRPAAGVATPLAVATSPTVATPPVAAAPPIVAAPLDTTTAPDARPQIYPYDATVIEERTFVFEQPSIIGNVLRRVYVGEVIRVLEQISTADGRHWVKVALGYDAVGYIEAARVTPTSHRDIVQYRPERVLREELPLAVGLRVGGETLGTGLLLRYQPFSRLGFTASFAGLLSSAKGSLGLSTGLSNVALRGTAISGGLTSFIVLANVSPLLEFGLSRLAYDSDNATLDLTNFYVSGGVEWISERGIFAGIALTYTRSMSVEVSYDYEYARDKTLNVPKFGVLNSSDVFQIIQPSVVVGYAF